MTSPERPIRLRLICESPPPSTRAGIVVEFGLQDKAGGLRSGVVLPDGSLRFEAEVRANGGIDRPLRFRGPVVQGTSTAPFLYLSCRPSGLPDAPWLFRLKVPLAGIDERVLGRNRDVTPVTLEGRIRATSGGSVALLGNGWAKV